MVAGKVEKWDTGWVGVLDMKLAASKVQMSVDCLADSSDCYSAASKVARLVVQMDVKMVDWSVAMTAVHSAYRSADSTVHLKVGKQVGQMVGLKAGTKAD